MMLDGSMTCQHAVNDAIAAAAAAAAAADTAASDTMSTTHNGTILHPSFISSLQLSFI